MKSYHVVCAQTAVRSRADTLVYVLNTFSTEHAELKKSQCKGRSYI